MLTYCRKILEKAGYQIEECEINNVKVPCVIYEETYEQSDISEPESLESQNPTYVWDTANFDDMELGIKKTEESIILWDENEQPETTNDNQIINDPCVSGEQTEQNDKDEKVELLFDSGYQVSTSSIDLSPDFMKDWLQEEKKLKKVPRPPQPQPQIQEQPDQPPEIVENGDLANNNRDREGNNYQAAENLVLDDNAIPRPENLDEHNENHIVLADDEPIGDFQEDDDVNESVDEASREVQFDQNSELSFSDESLVIHGIPFENYNILVRPENSGSTSESQETFQTAAGFPIWLLQMLNMSAEDPLNIIAEDAHFFSQGDGLGIHPSTININDDDSTSSSDRSGNSEGVIAMAATPSHPNSATATLSSDIDMSFFDALESSRVTHVLLDVNEAVNGERVFFPRMQNNFAQTEASDAGEDTPANTSAGDDGSTR